MALNSIASAAAGAGLSALGAVGNIIKNNNAMNPNNAYTTIKNLTNANNQFNLASAKDAMAFGQMSADQAMEFSAQQAQLNRNFQERMSNTSYQRAVKDLQAAGLNPVLAAMNGASTPTGATAQAYSSSGHQASADESGSSALVSVLGSMLSYMSTQEAAKTNAQTNLAIAEKNNSMSRFLGELNAILSRERMSLDERLGYANMANSYGIAGINAAASRYVADKNAQSALDSASAKYEYDYRLNKQQAGYSSALSKQQHEQNLAMKYLYPGSFTEAGSAFAYKLDDLLGMLSSGSTSASSAAKGRRGSGGGRAAR